MCMKINSENNSCCVYVCLCLCLFVFVVCCFVCCLSWFLLVPFLFSTCVRTYCIVLYRMFDTVIINAAFLFSSQKSNTKQNTT